MSDEAKLAEVAAALLASDCDRLVQLTHATTTDAVRVACCDALADVAEVYECSPDHAAGSAVPERVVVELFVSVLRAEEASQDVLFASLGALHDWCRLVPQTRVLAGEAGAFHAVVAAMHTDTTSVDLQTNGCGALAALMFETPANWRLAADADVMTSVLTAVRTHASCAALQTRACEALSHVITGVLRGGSAAMANYNAAHGAIELVTAALVSADAKASSAACVALRDLIGPMPMNIARAQRSGAFEAIMKAMRLHTQDLGIQTSGCTLLGRMALESSACAAAERLNAHGAIIHALEQFPADSMLQQYGFFALSRLLAATPFPYNAARHAGAVARVVHALQAHVADADVLLRAFEALRLLVNDRLLNSAEAFRLGADVALAEVLNTNIAHAAVVEPCIAALRCLCTNAALRENMSAGDLPAASQACVAIRAVAAAMHAYPEVLNIQGHGSAFITWILFRKDEPECAVAAAEAGVVDAVVAALRTFADDVALTVDAFMLFAKISERLSNLRRQGLHTPAASISDAFAATVTALHVHRGNVGVLEAAAHAILLLCDDVPGSSVCRNAVAPLCAALRAHHSHVSMQRRVLEALSKIVLDASAATAAVSAGPAGIGAVIELLMHSTPAQDILVLKFGCDVLVNVACCAEAKLSSADAVGPLVHVIAKTHPEIAELACGALLIVLQYSSQRSQHAAAAVRLGAAAAVPEAALMNPAVADLMALLESEAEAQAQAKVQAQVQAQAQAREEAARRADAMAAELIAEEEEAALAAAAPPARKSRRKRGGGVGAAAGGQRAEPASSESAPNAAPSLAAATAAALDELALNDASADAAADMPSAAAARRRRRAATKAARRQAGAGASGGEASAHGDEPASGGEDDVAEAEADAVASAEAGPAEALPPIDTAPSPAAAASLPPPPAPAMPVVMKECCVCLSDMPMAELLVVAPCGHRCLCDECWQNLQPPSARRCPICNTPAAMAMRVYEL
jgi:hypothetical protein